MNPNTRRRLRPTQLRRPAAPAAPAARRGLCVCGRSFDVLPEHAGWKGRCPTCFRDFEIRIAKDASGADVVSLSYSEDKKGLTPADTAAETSTNLNYTGGKAGAITEAGLKSVPELPDEAQFRCSCGALLSITKECFDKRVKCPKCGGRRLVTLGYDEASGGYTLHTFSLMDRPSGGTKLAVRLA